MSAAELLAALKPFWLLPFLFVALTAFVWTWLRQRRIEPKPDDGFAESEDDADPDDYEVAPPLDYAPCTVHGIRCDNDCERDFVRCAIELASGFAAVRRYDQGPVEYRYQDEERLYWPAFTVTHADGVVEHYEFKSAAGPQEEAQRLASYGHMVHWCGSKEREAFTSRAAAHCMPLERLREEGRYHPGVHRAHQRD